MYRLSFITRENRYAEYQPILDKMANSAILGIHPQFEDLITSCRSAYAIEDKLDKERTVFADTFDANRLFMIVPFD